MDIYGALSEYIGTCVSGATCTLLDINNTAQVIEGLDGSIAGQEIVGPGTEGDDLQALEAQDGPGRQQVLARLPDGVQVRALLRQQPFGGHGYPCGL